jgi:alpha-2-macroglobulin
MMRRLFGFMLLVAALLLGGIAAAQDDTAGLRAIETLPTDGSIDIPADSAITVIFNRPVVPLTGIEAQDSLPNPLQITPSVGGSGEWLNSAIYVYTPDPALAGGTTYSVNVDPALTAADGTPLEEAFGFTFTTAAPVVAEVIPEANAVSVRLDQSIQVRLSAPMDRASVESAFFLTAEDGSPAVSGTFEWSDDSAGFRFIPNANLALNTLYRAGFREGAVGAGGGASVTAIDWSFVTVPPPGIVSTNPFDGQPDAGLYAIIIYFASPMNPESLEGKVTIEPEPWREPDTYYSDYDNSYTLAFPVEPSTDYTVTIASGAEDVYGNRLEQPLTLRYSTVAFDPDVQLQAPYGVGFYNASNPQTQVYLTHRNVSAVELQLYRADTAEVLPLFVGANSYDPTLYYAPAAADLLRSWQIESVAPENARRYELLNLGGSGAVDCAGSPASRLRVGDSAVVISDPDPVRARAAAGDGEIVTLLYRDYALRVIGGPECLDDILWWEVELREGQTAWIAEGVGEEYFVQPAASVQTPVEINADGGALPAGIYFLSATSPETAALGYQPLKHFLVVGTVNLTFKTGIDSALVWATDVQTGLPIEGAYIGIYDANYQLIGEGTTNIDGLLRADLPRGVDLYAPRIAVLDDGTHFGVATTNWSQGIEGYDFGQNVDFAPEPYRAYVYTDRPIYRPDQPVYFRGVVRARDDVRYTQPMLSEIPVQIYGGDDGALLFEQTVPLTPFGTFSGQFDLSSDAPLGYYRIVANLPRPNPDEPYYGSEGTVSFQVAQYRAPEFQVTVTPENAEVVQGDTIRVAVESRYFFGGLVSNAEVSYSVIAQPYYFAPEGAPYYSFVDFNYDAGASEIFGVGGGEIASGTGVTDAEGRFIIELPADLRDATQSLTYTIEAVVTDESAQAVAGRTDVVVHKGEIYVGLQPREYVATVDSETTVDLLAVDWQGEPVVGQTLEVEVVERRWSSVAEEDEAGRTTWTYEVEDIPVTSGSVTTDANGEATFTFTPPAGGVYKVIARARDGRGNPVVASTNLWVSSGQYVTWRQQNSNRVDLIANQDEYLPGDTAEILIASPFQGSAEAIITVERGDVLLAERITLDSNSTVYRLPITVDYAPNVFVSVFIVKGVDENNPVAAFRMGMVQIGVDNSQNEITLAITPDRTDAGPGDEVTYTITTMDYRGVPVQAEVGVGLTDLASLSIADANTIPILNYFYGQQALGIRTASPLTINTDQLTQEVIDTIKGGGGGFGEGGIFDIREEFVDTAYWNAALVTDENGIATFTVTLPDNLTTWRLDARAVTLDSDGRMLVGDETFDLLSTKPLLIRPVTPRFFIVGDQAEVAAIVNNNTGQDATVDVSLQLGESAATLASEAIQTISIPAGGRQRVAWTLTVGDADALSLVFVADGVNIEAGDASVPPLAQGDDNTLPVYRYDAPETAATAGALAAGESVTETVAMPTDLTVTGAELTLEIQPSLVRAALDSLEALELVSNPSTEEAISSFLPNLMLNRVLREAGIDDPTLQAQLERNIGRALQFLIGTQKVDGGWGWYSRDSSDVLVTAYALMGLAQARNDGYNIEEGTIQLAASFLRDRLITPGLDVEAWRLNRQAIVLYALALAGAPDAARMATLYDMRESLAVYAQALLAQALAYADPADPRAQSLLDSIAGRAITSATGTHWEEGERDPYNWSTDTRTTAIVLDTLLHLRPDSELPPNVVRWLLSARSADAWESRQETAWALMGLARYIAVTGDVGLSAQAATETTSITLDGNALALTATDDSLTATQPLPTDAPSAVTIANAGGGTLYYTAQLDLTLPMAQVEALNRGIVVERRYTMGEGDDLTTVTSANVGDTITVRLTIIAPNDLHYVIVEDPIPAGTDAVDPNLATSQQIGTQPEFNLQDPLAQGWGWWWFSNIEFRDERMVLTATYLPAGTYEFVYTLRAGLPGVYNVLPATAREEYFPEVFGRSAGLEFVIGE